MYVNEVNEVNDSMNDSRYSSSFTMLYLRVWNGFRCAVWPGADWTAWLSQDSDSHLELFGALEESAFGVSQWILWILLVMPFAFKEWGVVKGRRE